MEYSIGVDIGGTKISAALVDRCGALHHQVRVATPSAGRADILSAVKESVLRLQSEVASRTDGTLRGIGIGTAGQVDFHGGRVLSGTSLIRDWSDVPIRDFISNATHLPVYVDNDVNVMTLTEAFLGAARGHTEVVCLALGTGVGGGVMMEGRILRGAWGGAGELGHVSVDMNGPLCNCGMRGCLEAFASGPGVVARLRDLWHRLETEPDTAAFREYRANPEAVSSRQVFRWMKEKDPHASQVVRQMLDALSIAIVGFIHAFNPTLIVLGGGMMEDGTWIRDGVASRIARMGMSSLIRGTEVRVASFGPETAVIGAAYQCWVYDGNE